MLTCSERIYTSGLEKWRKVWDNGYSRLIWKTNDVCLYWHVVALVQSNECCSRVAEPKLTEMFLFLNTLCWQHATCMCCYGRRSCVNVT